MNSEWRIIVNVALMAVLMVMLPVVTSAQVRVPPRVGVTVALVDELPPEAASTDPALIIRAGPGGTDVILLRSSSANGDVLTGAVFTLLLARQIQPQSPRQPVQVRVSTTSFPPNWRQEVERAQNVVNTLRSRERGNIPGLGMMRYTTLYLPRNYVVGKLTRR